MRADYGVPVTRPKMSIDFHYVEPHQREMDARLRNWALSQKNAWVGATAPGFDQYQSPPSVRRERSSPLVVDQGDAARIWSAVKSLPQHWRLALSWAYIRKSSPRDGCKMCATTPQGLWQLLRDGRQALINRGV